MNQMLEVVQVIELQMDTFCGCSLCQLASHVREGHLLWQYAHTRVNSSGSATLPIASPRRLNTGPAAQNIDTEVEVSVVKFQRPPPHTADPVGLMHVQLGNDAYLSKTAS